LRYPCSSPPHQEEPSKRRSHLYGDSPHPVKGWLLFFLRNSTV
jgi:hypothetical protein